MSFTVEVGCSTSYPALLKEPPYYGNADYKSTSDQELLRGWGCCATRLDYTSAHNGEESVHLDINTSGHEGVLPKLKGRYVPDTPVY